jgi:hypothetical protein
MGGECSLTWANFGHLTSRNRIRYDERFHVCGYQGTVVVDFACIIAFCSCICALPDGNFDWRSVQRISVKETRAPSSTSRNWSQPGEVLPPFPSACYRFRSNASALGCPVFLSARLLHNDSSNIGYIHVFRLGYFRKLVPWS